jgi:hypothetical protein
MDISMSSTTKAGIFQFFSQGTFRACRIGPFHLCSLAMSDEQKSSTQEFLDEIDGFIRRTGMTGTELGLRAVKDSGFVSRLRAGKDTKLGTADRVRAFMRAHEGNDRRKAATNHRKVA